MMKIFNFEFVKRIGFYISLASVVTLIAAALSYAAGFTGVLLEYYASNVMTIALIGIAAFFLMLIIDITSNLAPLALWVVSFVSLLAYVSNIYMYFTGIFYNGISAEAFKLIDPAVMTSTVLFIISFIAGNVAMYFNHSADEEV